MASFKEVLAIVITADATGAIRAFESTSAAAQKQAAVSGTVADANTAALLKWGAAGIAAGAIVTVGMEKAAKSAEQVAIAVRNSTTIFGSTSGNAVVKWAKDAADSLGLPENEAILLANKIGLVGRSFNLEGGALVSFATSTAARIRDISFATGTDIATVTNAFESALRGRGFAIKQFAGVIDPKDVTQYAQAHLGLIGTLTAEERTQATLGLVMQRTNLYADAFSKALKNGDPAALAENAKARFQDFANELGQGALPVFTQLLKVVDGIAAGIGDIPGPIKEIAGAAITIGALGSLGAGVTSFVIGGYQKLGSVIALTGRTSAAADAERASANTAASDQIIADNEAVAASYDEVTGAADTAATSETIVVAGGGGARAAVAGVAGALGTAAAAAGVSVLGANFLNSLANDASNATQKIKDTTNELVAAASAGGSDVVDSFTKAVAARGNEKTLSNAKDRILGFFGDDQHIQFGNLSAYSDVFQKTFDQLQASSPEGAQKLVTALKAQNNELDHSSEAYKNAASILNGWQHSIDEAAKAEKALAGITQSDPISNIADKFGITDTTAISKAIADVAKANDAASLDVDGLTKALEAQGYQGEQLSTILADLESAYGGAASGASTYASNIQKDLDPLLAMIQATNQLDDAKQSEIDAQKALSDLTAHSGKNSDQYRQAVEQLTSAQLAQRDAVLSVLEAQTKLDAANQKLTGITDPARRAAVQADMAQAQSEFDAATLELKAIDPKVDPSGFQKAGERLSAAHDRLDEARQQLSAVDPSTDPNLYAALKAKQVEAQKASDSANRSLSTSTAAVAKAQKDVNDNVNYGLPGSKAYNDAVKAVRDAHLNEITAALLYQTALGKVNDAMAVSHDAIPNALKDLKSLEDQGTLTAKAYNAVAFGILVAAAAASSAPVTSVPSDKPPLGPPLPGAKAGSAGSTKPPLGPPLDPATVKPGGKVGDVTFPKHPIDGDAVNLADGTHYVFSGNTFQRRAYGGRVNPGTGYWVGDGGKPELFFPDQPGTIGAPSSRSVSPPGLSGGSSAADPIAIAKMMRDIVDEMRPHEIHNHGVERDPDAYGAATARGVRSGRWLSGTAVH